MSEQLTPEAGPDNNEQRELAALLKLKRKAVRERNEARARVEIITPHENNPVAEYFSSPNTPETDALVLKKQPFGGTDYEWIELSRRLERERNEAREDAINYFARIGELEKERDEAREDAAHWKTEYLIVAARLCGKKHPRDNGIISEHEIIPKLERERDNWEQTAADYLEGMHYYRGLVQEIGETIGEAAYLQDDGGKVDSVLCAKIPELVVDLKRERDEAREALSRLQAAARFYIENPSSDTLLVLIKELEGAK